MNNCCSMSRLVFALIVLVFILLDASSQPQSGENKLIQQDHLIESKDLIGKWRSLHNPGINIEFVDSTYQLVLISSGSNPFYFQKDSLGNVSSNGWYPQWPPPSCDLFFNSKDTLRIVYSLVGDTLESAYFLKIY